MEFFASSNSLTFIVTTSLLEDAEPEDPAMAAEWNALYVRYRRKQTQVIKEQARQEFLGEHGEYLKSTAWQQRRQRVLTRDNHLCQACLERPATEVHHLSYRYWQNEPLFDLTSICRTCHEAITALPRATPDHRQFSLPTT